MNPQSVLLGRKPPLINAHGGGVRGATLPRRSPQFEGRFGRIFRALPPADFDVEDLKFLADEGNMSAVPEQDKGKPAAAAEDSATAFHDPEENTGIDAGYTYLGQFIDHDITFDPASQLQRQNDPDGLVDFRTPRLDLDCLYGRGPDDQPYMYTSDGKRFLLGEEIFFGDDKTPRTRDLPRHSWEENQNYLQQSRGSKKFGRALIGDKRNDENVIVSQLHSAMLQFHNRLADENPSWDFSEIQRVVRWHYQYIVVHDFLPKIVGCEMVNSILPHIKSKPEKSIFEDKPQFRFYHPRESLFIPIEFSAAAYRFGHSMVRPIYRLNTNHKNLAPGDHKSLEGRFFIFAGVARRGLNGFGPFPNKWAIDWSLYFDINDSRSRVGKERVQPAYKIDSSLVNPLAFLPEFSRETLPQNTPLTLKTLQPDRNPGAISNLAERNLLRGLFMSLPSGQDVARAMGETALDDSELFIGKATHENVFGTDPTKKNKSIADLGRDGLKGKAPLWLYILAEALHYWKQRVIQEGKSKDPDQADEMPITLGPVGGRIVAETLIGLLVGDSQSFLSQDPNWKPIRRFRDQEIWINTMGDLIKYALRL